MADLVSVKAVNIEEVKRALYECPELAFKFVGSDLKRSGNRFRKAFIRERMSGPPGIAWNTANHKVGGNVRAFVRGKQLVDLELQVRISRFLRAHEEGATINAPDGGWLYLSKKTGQKGAGEIYAKVKQVKIPARLGFVNYWDSNVNDIVERAEKALGRSFQVAFERRMKSLTSVLSEVGHG